MSSSAKSLVVRAARSAGLFFWARRVKLRLYGLLPVSVRDDAEWVRFYSSFISKGALVFDIGANVGIKTKTFLGLGARVVCVEPLSAALTELEGVFGSHPGVTIVPKALSSQEGEAELYPCDGESGLSTMSSRWIDEGRFSGQKMWDQPQTVKTTTLDELCSLFGVPVFCKIDVEGYELEVLNGLTRALPTLSFEFHGELADTALGCINRLMTVGSYRFAVSFDEPALWERGWVSAEDLVQYLEGASKDLEGEIYARLSV